MLFSPDRRQQSGPKGPSAELIRAVVEMKQRNPNWGCPRIAQQMALAFHIPIDKDVVRRILARHYSPGQNPDGPSWLTFLGHMKDSLWSIDLFRCESATLRTHWVLVVMDQYSPDYWIRRPCRDGRWWRTLSDVQPRHSGPTRDAKVPKLRQRSALSVPPMASQSADTGGDRTQVHPLCSPVPSIRGKANRHPATRVFESHVVLDDGRSRKQTARF
jgi:hypothetical protein